MPKIKFDAVLGHERYFEDVDFDNKNVLPSNQLALDFSKSNVMCGNKWFCFSVKNR